MPVPGSQARAVVATSPPPLPVAPAPEPAVAANANPIGGWARMAFDHAAIGTVLLAGDGGLLAANPAFCALVGYAHDEVLALAAADLIVPADLAAAHAAARRVGRGEEDRCEVELRLVRRDGATIWTRVTLAFAPGKGAAAGCFVAQTQDVTPHKAFGTALRASEARLRLALEAAGMACWDRDAEGGEARSPGMPALFGLPPEDIVAPRARYRALVHPDDRAALRAADRRLLAGADGYAVEYRVVQPDGSVRWLRDRGEAVRGAHGEHLRAVGVTQDITEQKRAEAALVEREACFRALAEQLPAAVYARPLEPGARLTYLSPRIADVLGYPADILLERPDPFPAEIHPDDRESAEEARVRAAATGGSLDARYRARHADGRWVWLRDRAVLVRGDDRPLHWQGLISDAEPDVAAEDALRAATEAAEAASRAKDAVLRTVSHDLRTPLTAICGYAELLRLDGHLTADQDADVAAVLQGAAQALALIDGVLDLARAKAGRLELAIADVDLAALVEEARATLAPQAEGKGVALFATSPPELVVRGDPVRLRQVVLNLASNAVKFTDRGWVTVAAHAACGGAELCVTDTGPGIGPNDLARVFDEFDRAGPGSANGHGGAGLGLAIARKLVEAHGGSIRAESRVGEGSTFTAWLPIAPPSSMDAPCPEPSVARREERATAAD